MNETLQLWSVAGTWFAGFCTLAAVVFSLWLARNVNNAKLRVIIDKIDEDNSLPALDIDGCRIKVINCGSVPAHINKIGWEVGAWMRKRVVWVQDDFLRNDVPATLLPGDGKDYFVPSTFISVENGIVFPSPKKESDRLYSVRPIYVVVRVFSGKLFAGKMPNQLIKELDKIEYEKYKG